MSRAEHDAMAATGRVQPSLDGREMKHVTSPPAASAFRAADLGSVFVEFDVDDAQIISGGPSDWFIIYGPNSVHGRNALRNGRPVTELPAVQNIVITGTK